MKNLTLVEIKLDVLLIYILPRQILNYVNLLIVDVKVFDTGVLYLCCNRLYNRDQEITLDQEKNLVTTDTQTYPSICMQFSKCHQYRTTTVSQYYHQLCPL